MLFFSVVWYFDDCLRRECNRETLGSATQNGQTRGRRVFRPGRFGKTSTQSAANGKTLLMRNVKSQLLLFYFFFF